MRVISRNTRASPAACTYGAFRPHVLPPDLVAALSRFHEQKFAGDDASSGPAFERLRAWLLELAPVSAPSSEVKPSQAPLGVKAAALALTLRAWFGDDRKSVVPKDAIYLNLAQHGCEYPRFFSWLEARPDVKAVFLVHDLLPLDSPEYFRDGYKALFEARLTTIMRHADAIIATAPCTAARIASEYRARELPAPPIHAQPLASPLEGETAALADAELAGVPYFVALATIEPRKNHALLLDLWRDLAVRGGDVPKLVCIGGRGWGSAQIVDAFARSTAIARHVRWVSGLSKPALRRLLANARALLAPSFAEGYGIPLVEALALGAPVICSDIAVFREVAQERARFISPLDGVGWRSAIIESSRENSPARTLALDSAARFAAPKWESYFSGVEAFLASL